MRSLLRSLLLELAEDCRVRNNAASPRPVVHPPDAQLFRSHDLDTPTRSITQAMEACRGRCLGHRLCARRPPATRAHSPRMISARTTIGIVISIFRATGQGDGEPCARHGNADYGTPFHGPCMGGEWKKAEIGAPKRHYPQEKRADIHHRHRCRQGNRQHKFRPKLLCRCQEDEEGQYHARKHWRNIIMSNPIGIVHNRRSNYEAVPNIPATHGCTENRPQLSK